MAQLSFSFVAIPPVTIHSTGTFGVTICRECGDDEDTSHQTQLCYRCYLDRRNTGRGPWHPYC